MENKNLKEIQVPQIRTFKHKITGNTKSNRGRGGPVIQCFNNFELESIDMIKPENIIVADTETTGLDVASSDEMIQFAAYDIHGEKANIFVTPLWNLKKDVIAKFENQRSKGSNLDIDHHINLINQAYASTAYAPKTLAHKIAEMFNNKVIIFHNGVAFDAVLINKLFACYGLNVNYAVLDTMNLA